MKKQTETIISLWVKSSTLSRNTDLTLSGLHGIGFSEYMVLFHLINSPNKTLRRIDLAEALSRTASGVTRMLLPMEKIGLVKKEINPRDARVSLVKITESGEELFENASISLDEKSEQLLKRIDAKDLNHLLKTLDDM